MRLGEPPLRSGRVRKISSPLRFHPLTVQSVTSRYTDNSIPGPRQNFLSIRIHQWYPRTNKHKCNVHLYVSCPLAYKREFPFTYPEYAATFLADTGHRDPKDETSKRSRKWRPQLATALMIYPRKTKPSPACLNVCATYGKSHTLWKMWRQGAVVSVVFLKNG